MHFMDADENLIIKSLIHSDQATAKPTKLSLPWRMHNNRVKPKLNAVRFLSHVDLCNSGGAKD